MREVEALLDEVYAGQKRLSRAMLHRYAVAAEAPAEIVGALDGLPEGEYDQDEVAEALGISSPAIGPSLGVPANQLTDSDLLRELAEVHRTRDDALRHGSDQALARHDDRMAELEGEYLHRFPDREIDPQRLRAGARTRNVTTIRALEDTEQAAWAIDDEAPVPGLTGDGGSTGPGFREPDVPVGGPGPRTGAEQPWEPVDLAVAEGHDPTPANVDRARRELAEQGRSAIERTVP
jgi:hypothetical protein